MKLKQKCLVEGCDEYTISKYRHCREHTEASPERRFSHIKRTAKIRKMPFNMSFKQFYMLILPNVCYYCKGKLTGTGGGLDRLDSYKGYVKGNVVACCLECNVVKSNLLTDKEMLEVTKLLKKLRKTTRVWQDHNPQKRRKKHGIQRRK